MPDQPAGTASLDLIAEFPPVEKSVWEAAIAADLKGADYEKKLVAHPEPGLSLRPYYRREDLEALARQVEPAPGEFPFIRGVAAGWTIEQDWTPPPGAIRADEWHELGATAVQEVAFALAAAVDQVSAAIDAGATAAAAIAGVELAFAVGSAYFVEIAKLRATRLLWGLVCSAYAVEGQEAVPRIRVRTSRANKSRYDAYTNLLRVTTESLAAIIGGCQRLTVEASGFDEHLAINLQRILQEEAHLDKVADPAGGSYYIEVLTDQLARAAWSLFQQIESKGGFAREWASGSIHRQLEESRSAAAKAIAIRRRTLVGVNNYPNLLNRDPASLSWLDRDPQLGAPRLAQPFELIRSRTAEHARKLGRVPVVLLLKRGDVKMRNARAMFSLNFFGCAGFDIVEGEEVTAVGADLIVLCSSDPEYLELARDVCPRVAAPVLVAGRPTDADALRTAGVQDFIYLGCDAVQTLTAWQRRLGMPELADAT